MNFNSIEFERCHLALALKDLSETWKQQTIDLFYRPFYADLIDKELAADKTE